MSIVGAGRNLLKSAKADINRSRSATTDSPRARRDRISSAVVPPPSSMTGVGFEVNCPVRNSSINTIVAFTSRNAACVCPNATVVLRKKNVFLANADLAFLRVSVRVAHSTRYFSSRVSVCIAWWISIAFKVVVYGFLT